MTKKEWYEVWLGVRVINKTWIIDRTVKPPQSVDVILTGTVVRVNANCSQALVKWDGHDGTIWYGRTGIELLK